MIRLSHVSKIYLQAGSECDAPTSLRGVPPPPVVALDDVSLTVPRGEFVAVMGRSGSGKSTLLNMVAGIDVPTRGEVWVDDQNLAAMDDTALTALRREKVGIVFQFFNLLSPLNVRENVALPALLAGEPERAVMQEADRLIERVDLAARSRSRPHTLSGGEMQRAAIARALIHRPRVLLADEPTGNLDSRSASQILSLLRDLGAEAGATIMLVTHSREASAAADRILEMRDGRFVDEASAVGLPLRAR